MQTMQKALTIVLVLSLSAGSASAGLQDQLDSVFGDLTNATSPMLYQGQRRGAVIGGSFYARSRIMRPNLINFTPPSFRAGCGGIDLFGGSFSFINMDQFIQLLRNIGQNAVGYAFQIALNAICGDCQEILSYLQREINRFNQYFGNSCQMAKMLVDNTIGPAIEATGQRIHSILTLGGVVDDWFDSIAGENRKDPVQKLQEHATAETKMAEQRYVKGNMIWRALKTSAADTWFGNPDNTLLEAIMSLTGTVIVQDAQPAEDGQGYQYKIVHLGRLLKVQDLLRGGKEIDIWRCDNPGSPDGCLNPSKQTVEIHGLDEKVQKLADEVVKAFHEDTGFPSEVQGFLENSFGFGGMVRNLYRSHAQLGRLFSSRVAPVLSVEMVYVIVSDMIRAARLSLRNIDHPHSGEAARLLDEAWQEVSVEFQKLISERGSVKDMYVFYSNLIAATQPEKFDHSVGVPANAGTQVKAAP